MTILTAAIGCLLLIAVGLIIIGALLGELIGPVKAPAPPQWLLAPAALLPVSILIYVRAYKKRQESHQWLRRWAGLARKKVVGQQGQHQPKPVEEVWLEDQLKDPPLKNPVQRLLDNTTLWGWVTLLSFLALAYLCLWLGLMAAGR